MRSLLAGSGQLRAVRMLLSASPPLAAAAFVFVIAEGVLPNLVIVAMGRVTGHITGAVENGLGSPAGHG